MSRDKGPLQRQALAEPLILLANVNVLVDACPREIRGLQGLASRGPLVLETLRVQYLLQPIQLFGVRKSA